MDTGTGTTTGMEHRRVPRLGRDLSVVGLGCWQLGADWGDVGEDQAFAILGAAADAGVTFLDTADVYGDGRSERLVGAFAHERGRDGFVVAWHHWEKVAASHDAEAWVREAAWRRARDNRPARRPWHRNARLEPEVAGTLEALRSLPGQDRRILLLDQLTAQPVPEIGRQVGLAPAVVEERLASARARFAERVEVPEASIRTRLAGLEAAVDPNSDGDAHDAARIALIGVVEPFASFADSPLARAGRGALALGTLDAKLFFHAGMIEAALGNADGARTYLEDALAIDPSFEPTAVATARATLAAMP